MPPTVSGYKRRPLTSQTWAYFLQSSGV